MRVYAAIMFAQTPKPLDGLFRLPRFWTWFARILSEPVLLQSSVAAELLYSKSSCSFLKLYTTNYCVSAALEVGGTQGKDIWGTQWIKLLALLYDGVTTGIHGSTKLIGGATPEGTAARVRVQLEIEKIMGTSP